MHATYGAVNMRCLCPIKSVAFSVRSAAAGIGNGGSPRLTGRRVPRIRGFLGLRRGGIFRVRAGFSPAIATVPADGANHERGEATHPRERREGVGMQPAFLLTVSP